MNAYDVDAGETPQLDVGIFTADEQEIGILVVRSDKNIGNGDPDIKPNEETTPRTYIVYFYPDQQRLVEKHNNKLRLKFFMKNDKSGVYDPIVTFTLDAARISKIPISDY